MFQVLPMRHITFAELKELLLSTLVLESRDVVS